jgi:transposase
MLTATDLPDDIAALRAMLLAREEQMQHLKAQLNSRTAEIEHLNC